MATSSRKALGYLWTELQLPGGGRREERGWLISSGWGHRHVGLMVWTSRHVHRLLWETILSQRQTGLSFRLVKHKRPALH